MGDLIEYRCLAEVDGFVAAAPFSTLSAAVACVRSFGPQILVGRVICYWSGRTLWKQRLGTRRAQGAR